MMYWGAGALVFFLVVFMMSSNNNGDDLGDSIPANEIPRTEAVAPAPAATPAATPAPTTPRPVNYATYNIDYMNDNVKGILTRRMGNAKTDFYLPSTGYVNVSRGAKYGVAYVIQNVNPKVPEGNEFSFNFAPNVESLGDCGIDVKTAQSWIERGWASTGMIAGQWREDYNEWYDAMTIYFAFPGDVEPCNVKYDFVITRDGAAYDSRTLEFNLI